ncbi:hypothetical protein DPMN_032291 [Dreissena polymorpha]|uniref:Uncharacterized protein n=1 Tax=Dreissena polymorpha TaxID=45954 RepID=A0A9D4RHU2_DREPO|nr:hypothetical protein DPMN_032291 [Dreissena polymorpha]
MPRPCNVFQATGNIFELVQDIITTKKNASPPWWQCFSTNQNHFQTLPRYHWEHLLINFTEDRTINVASIVKNAPPPYDHIFQQTRTIFEFIKDVNRTVITRFYYSHIMKNAPPNGDRVFQPTEIIFELVQDVIGTNLLNKFHEDQTIIVVSRVLIRKNVAPPDFIWTNLLTKLDDDLTINEASRKNAPPNGGHVFEPTVIIFKIIQYIIRTNLLTKFHEDRTINVASRVLTRKNAPPPWRPCFSCNRDHVSTRPIHPLDKCSDDFMKIGNKCGL